MHHHGADGSCHDGPGGMFGCDRCELDSLRAAEAERETDAAANRALNSERPSVDALAAESEREAAERRSLDALAQGGAEPLVFDVGEAAAAAYEVTEVLRNFGQPIRVRGWDHEKISNLSLAVCAHDGTQLLVITLLPDNTIDVTGDESR